MTNPVQIHAGLDGIFVAQSVISEVDGEQGILTYRGYTIAELAGKATYEEVAHLLWAGHLPTASELSALRARLVNEREVPASVKTVIAAMPNDADPMDVLRTASSALGTALKIKGKPTVDQAIALTAAFPTILALFHRQRQGKPAIAPRTDLSHAANYLYMMTGVEPAAKDVAAMDEYLVLLADHGMNASTFTARVIASTESDVASAVTGAIGALKGPLHGGAPSLVLTMLNEVGTPENATAWVTRRVTAGGKIFGIGHRVYRTYDPRAEILREMARTMVDPQLFALAYAVEQAALDELHKRDKVRLWTNVDYYTAAVLATVGLPGDLFPPTFAVSRVAGWTAHVLEQAGKNRLMRPESQYVGPRGKTFAPAERRTGE